MSEPCSNDSGSNGCARCAQALGIYLKYQQKNIEVFGEMGYGEGAPNYPRYLKITDKGNANNSNVAVLGECPGHEPPQGYTCSGAKVGTRWYRVIKNSNRTTIISGRIDDCGNIIVDETIDGVATYTDMRWMLFSDPPNPCEGNFTSVLFVTKEWGRQAVYASSECGGAGFAYGDEYYSPTKAQTITRDQIIQSNDNITVFQTIITDEYGETDLSDPKEEIYFKNLTLESIDKFLNTKSCGSTYINWQNIQIADDSAAIQSFNVAIAIPKEGFSKEYKSIGGTLYLYYGGEEGESPCCQSCGGPECFTGTIAYTSNFNLSASSIIDDNTLTNYYATNALRFNNIDSNITPGTVLKACYTIDQVSFV